MITHLGRPSGRRDENIRMDLKEIGIMRGICVDLAQDRDYWRSLHWTSGFYKP